MLTSLHSKIPEKNDIRIGAGLSLIDVSYAAAVSKSYDSNGNLTGTNYEFYKRDSFGINFILENSYDISHKFLIGLKLFTQPYFNGDINSGILLKTGLRL